MAIFEKKYRFTSNRHSKRGLMSLLFGLISVISFFVANILTIRNMTSMATRMGGVGFIASIFGIVSLVLGLSATSEPDVFPILPRWGLCMGLAAVLLWGGIVYVGILGS
ncbi:MAG: hypothetical protein IJU43_05545 [Lachnospiraceae bacterium]|nr:hypothetical protein [Lachnospiraceae bacterium]